MILQTNSECVNLDSLPCCTEETTENCEDMDTSCHWQCKDEPVDEFCIGGTDMYMQGFDVCRQFSFLYS